MQLHPIFTPTRISSYMLYPRLQKIIYYFFLIYSHLFYSTSTEIERKIDRLHSVQCISAFIHLNWYNVYTYILLYVTNKYESCMCSNFNCKLFIYICIYLSQCFLVDLIRSCINLDSDLVR